MTDQRTDIDLSWRRSALAGMSVTADLRDLPVEDFDGDGRLGTAARPVLDLLSDELHDTSLCVILSDRDSRLIDIRVGSPALRDAIERSGGALGRRFTESSTGTNAIATAHELRRPVRVDGSEHFVEQLRALSCYGQPIVNPITGAADGVLTLVRPANSEPDLLATLARRIVRDIENRLLDGSSREEQRLLAAYRRASGARHPVIAVSGELTVANAAAIDRLAPDDHAVLRGYAASRQQTQWRVSGVALPSGPVVDLLFKRVEATHAGVLVELIESDGTPRSIAAADLEPDAEVARWRADRTAVLVGGEPGSGRTTFLTDLAGGGHARLVHAADLALRGRTEWLAAFDHACVSAAADHAMVGVEDVHLLPLDLLAAVLRHTAGQWRAFSCGTFSSLGPDQAALMAPIVARRELLPLRLRTGEVASFVAQFVGARGVRFTASAIAALAAQPWPGNLTELRSVVDTTLLHRSAGDVRAVDLPSPYSVTAAPRQLTPLDVAERDAILTSLARHAGNKSRVAVELGISRTTLYERLRFFGIAS